MTIKIALCVLLLVLLGYFAGMVLDAMSRDVY